MATPVQVNDAQQALLDGWARGTEFELDIYDSPKRQFNVLAKLLGWVGGEEPWNAKWLEAFDEVYIWRAPCKDAIRRCTMSTNHHSNQLHGTYFYERYRYCQRQCDTHC